MNRPAARMRSGPHGAVAGTSRVEPDFFVVPLGPRLTALCVNRVDASAESDRHPPLRARIGATALKGPLAHVFAPRRGSGARSIIIVQAEAQALAEAGAEIETRFVGPLALDADWLQSPIRDIRSLFDDLTPAARARTMSLLLVTAPPLYRMTDNEDYAAVAAEALTHANLPRGRARAALACGRGMLLSIRSDRIGADMASVATVSRQRSGLLSGVRSRVATDGAAVELHVFVPRRLPPASLCVFFDRAGQGLVIDPPTAPTHRLDAWMSSVSAATRDWASEMLAATRGAEARPTTGNAAPLPAIAPLELFEIFATRSGVLVAGMSPAEAPDAASLRIERGANRVETALPGPAPVDKGANGAPSFCVFAPCADDGDGQDGVRVSALDPNGRVVAAAIKQPRPLDESVGEMLVRALRRSRRAIDEAQIAYALAQTRSTLTWRPPAADVVEVGPGERAALSIVAPFPSNPDIVKVRAATLCAADTPQSLETVYFWCADDHDEKRIRLVEHARAVYGQTYKLVILARGATRCEQVQRALAEIPDAALLLGEACMPHAPQTLALLRRAMSEFPDAGVFGGMVVSPHGAPLDAGGRVRVLEGARDVEIDRRARYLFDGEWPAHAATDLATTAAALLRKNACDAMRDVRPVYADPDHLITQAIARLQRDGVLARTIVEARFIDFSPRARLDPLDERTDRMLLGMALRRATDPMEIAAE